MDKRQPKVTLGITTYNRIGTLKRMIESLYASNLEGIDYTIRIFDDCSEQYGTEELQQMFPEKVLIHRHGWNHGADYNIGFMYRSFLETDDEILFNCDSDLIFNENWLQKGLALLEQTEGILSLFNSSSHETVADIGGELCIKNSVGSAGTLMQRDVVRLICDQISKEESYLALDVNWSNLLQTNKIKLYTTKESLVQHIGIYGFNSTKSGFDYGKGFTVDSIINGQIINDVLEEANAVQSKEPEIRKLYYLFPFDRIKQGSQIVIYGAGRVGQDYLQQIRLTQYCDVTAVVDQSYMNLPGARSPEELKNIECDYVLVAAHFSSVRESMKKNIMRINGELRHKLVDKVCYSIRLL
ncbi:MAG: glycosyltransferase family 2 protein [Lachnospiraceae bacterium]|nr:glycosyltransferase family 2 protein [Lachnospiraceae bacterium]